MAAPRSAIRPPPSVTVVQTDAYPVCEANEYAIEVNVEILEKVREKPADSEAKKCDTEPTADDSIVKHAGIADQSPPMRRAPRRRGSSTKSMEVHGAAHASHGHGHEDEATLFGQVAAGAICFLLYYFFCIVFSASIFQELVSTTSFGIGQGVSIVMLGIGVGCLSFASPWGSDCNIVLAGPDLLPIIFAQESGRAIVGYLDGESPEKVIPTMLTASEVMADPNPRNPPHPDCRDCNTRGQEVDVKRAALC
jgi:hypothetical protein